MLSIGITTHLHTVYVAFRFIVISIFVFVFTCAQNMGTECEFSKAAEVNVVLTYFQVELETIARTQIAGAPHSVRIARISTPGLTC
jgi:hypothetical protein